MRQTTRLAFFSLLAIPLIAADHGDGLLVSENPEYDISDFFVFPHTDDQGQDRAAYILSVHPGADSRTRFAPDMAYHIRSRPIEGWAEAPFGPIVSDSQETLVDCRVSQDQVQILSCTLYTMTRRGYRALDTATTRVGDRDGGSNPAFKVYAGLAADQLFSDRARVRMPVWQDRGFNELEPDGSPVWPGVNSQAGKNVLSIVVDLDIGVFPDGVAQEAVVGETLHVHPPRPDTPAIRRRRGLPAEELIQVDRMGRVEITVFVITDQFNEVRDRWNEQSTFALTPEDRAYYTPFLQEGLERLDLFELTLTDQKVRDWPVPHPWVDLIMSDFLVVDMSRPVDPATAAMHYLDIELGMYLGDPARAGVVGGRLCNEDVIDRTLTTFINGTDFDKPSRGVGVPEPARACGSHFPFVALPFEDASGGGY